MIISSIFSIDFQLKKGCYVCKLLKVTWVEKWVCTDKKFDRFESLPKRLQCNPDSWENVRSTDRILSERE